MINKICFLVLITILTLVTQATPEFQRRYRVQSCQVCHTITPKLNERGLDFLNRGYRPDPELGLSETETVRLSAWLNGRYDNRIDKGISNTDFGKIELISGGSIGDQWNYFVEWRALSLSRNSDGSIKDRTGRFEDLWANWNIGGRWNLQFGQYRPLGQVDPGRKFSLSAPEIFHAKLEGTPILSDSRLSSLRSFSTYGRSPSITLGYQSIQGELSSDGLFHNLSVIFPGEFSIPLTREAEKNASFEFESRAKGVLFETYYRNKLNSLGVNAFVGKDRWQSTLVGEFTHKNWNFLAGAGLHKHQGQDKLELISSLATEYIPIQDSRKWQPAIGVRADYLSQSDKTLRVIPYLAVASPSKNDLQTLVQLEYNPTSQHERLRLDLSIFF